MIRILIVTQHYPPEKSGNASRIHDLSFHLSKLGCDIQILAPHPTFPIGSFPRKWTLSSESVVENLKLTNLWSWQPSVKDPNYFISRLGYYLIFPFHGIFWVIINYRSFDVIITSSPPLFTHIPGILAKMIFKKKWVMDIRDLWIEASVGLGFVKKGSIFEISSKMLENQCLRKADLICVTTKELGRRLNQDSSVQQKIRVIPNGVDTQNFTNVSPDKKNQIIYTGNVGYAQDLDKVILAMKNLKQRYPIQFLIVGDGDLLPQLRELVGEEDLSQTVLFTGAVPRDQIPILIKESLVGIAPLKDLFSLEYAAPTKVYEYMAGEIPFIGCGRGEIELIARESQAGIIAKNTVDSISETIISLLENPSRMQQMGRSGREYVEKYYSRQNIARLLKDYIEAIP